MREIYQKDKTSTKNNCLKPIGLEHKFNLSFLIKHWVSRNTIGKCTVFNIGDNKVRLIAVKY
jgi:hypothetical protein